MTWGGRSDFEYEGSIKSGARIRYGEKGVVTLHASKYEAMVAHFHGKTIQVGASRDNPRLGTLEHWLREHVPGPTISSYVAPILVNEGVADRVGNMLRFKA